MKVLHTVCMGLLLACLTGCGFHRREPVKLDPVLFRPWIQTSAPYSPFIQQLREALRSSGSVLAASPDTATALLIIHPETLSSNLISVSSTQSTRQYSLTLSVLFEAQATGGQQQTGLQSVSESRVLTTASNKMLGSSNEAAALYQQMRTAVVRDLMVRLSSQEITDKLGSVGRKRSQIGK